MSERVIFNIVINYIIMFFEKRRSTKAYTIILFVKRKLYHNFKYEYQQQNAISNTIHPRPKKHAHRPL